jgi:hypothetical protein
MDTNNIVNTSNIVDTNDVIDTNNSPETRAATKRGGFTLNLPPAINSDSIYELFFFNNGTLTNAAASTSFAKSLLINRTKHEAWETVNKYADMLKNEKEKDTYFGFSYHTKIDCNKGHKDMWKRTSLALDEQNNGEREFTIAPAYKISWPTGKNLSGPSSTLEIEIFDKNINDKEEDENGSYYTYSYERYLEEKFGKHLYTRNPNNERCLTIPHAVSHSTVLAQGSKNKFVFNSRILDTQSSSVCTIEFRNCELNWDPLKLYSKTAKHTTTTDTIFDIASDNFTTLKNALTSVNNSYKNATYTSLFNNSLWYGKLRVAPRVISNNAQVIFTSPKGVTLPGEIEDLRQIHISLGNWFSKSAFKSTYAFPSFISNTYPTTNK